MIQLSITNQIKFDSISRNFLYNQKKHSYCFLVIDHRPLKAGRQYRKIMDRCDGAFDSFRPITGYEYQEIQERQKYKIQNYFSHKDII